MDIARPLCAGALAWLLAACSVSAPLSLESTGTVRGSGESVFMAAVAKDEPANRATFGKALATAFAANSINVSEAGNLVVDYGVSISDATGGVVAGEVQAGKPDEEQAWLASKRSGRNFDKCDAKRLRATLVLIDRATNATLYRGSATQIECEFSDSDLEAMARALVSDALSEHAPPAIS